MGKTPVLAALLLVTILRAGAAAQDARTVVDNAVTAMGMAGLTSITYSGIAAQGNFGQSRTISFGLASTSIRDYVRTIDFAQPSSRATGTALPPAAAGGPAPPPGVYDQTITPATPAWAQQLQIWVTPWGFLRGAAAASPTVRSRKIDGADYKLVTWSPAQRAPSGAAYRLVGYINADNLVERVETWVEHPVLGDMHVALFYTAYSSVDGVMVPARIAERRVGMETFVAEIRKAQPNPPGLAALMAAAPPAGSATGAAAAAAPPAAASERLADGVYRITGGYTALVVEFADHVVVLEGGQSEARGLAIIAEARRLFPAKRIKYVVNSHAHFDHASGLAPFVADGAVVVTDDTSRYFLEQALRTPRTLVGDTLAQARKRPRVEGVLDKRVLRDAVGAIELYHVEKLAHSDGMLIAWLPKQRILFTADFAVPGPDQPVNPGIVTLVENIERLGIDFDRHVLVHTPNPDRPMTRAELVALVKGAK